MRILLFSFLAVCAAACAHAPTDVTRDANAHQASASSSTSAIARARELQARLVAFAKDGDGTVAATVVHLPSGAVASVNGGRRLPMMSVFKLPIAIVTLAAIDEGTWKMDERIPITRDEIRSSFSPVADAWKRGETAPSLETILRTVVQDSDNTSGDKLVTMNGGGHAATASLQKMGLLGVDIAEEEIDIQARLDCAGTARPARGWTEDALARCTKSSPPAAAAAAKSETDASPNGATTDALAHLLVKLDRGEILSHSTRTWLLTTLERTRTGPARIKGDLPPNTKVAHKTGTGQTIDGMTIATNDVGLVSLPDGSRLAIAVLTAGQRGDQTAREATIAKIARAAWDAFVLPPR